jgi:hypothetical protein
VNVVRGVFMCVKRTLSQADYSQCHPRSFAHCFYDRHFTHLTLSAVRPSHSVSAFTL